VKASKRAKKGKPTGKPGGRPSGYREEFAEQARKLCRLGATDKELADFFGVDEATIIQSDRQSTVVVLANLASWR